MKKLFLAGMIIFSATSYAHCDYANVNSPIYKVSDLKKQYMSLDFVLSEKTSSFTFNLNNKKYEKFANSELKISRTGVQTKFTQERNSGSYRYKDITIGGNPYKLDKASTTEFITPSCDKIYYTGSNPNDDFIKSDNTKLNDDDVLRIFGNAITPVTIKANSRYDEFDGMYSIQTDFFQDEYMLRGNYSQKTGKLEVLQIYLNTKSIFGWSNFSMAKDTNGNSYSVTKIDSDVDCKGSSHGLPCITKEVVGININEELLRQNTSGFKLKLYGKQEQVIEISPNVIKPFLVELDKIKK